MEKVLLGMSGGVDSSTAAILLKQQGYEVVGATMVLFDNEDDTNSLTDAKKVCDSLGIKHYIIDLKEDFKKRVIDNFIECYKNGTTPNPCVECNKYLKFDALYKKALELDCTYLATGHYARIENGYLKKAKELSKDQSYFLYGIKKEVLNHLIFPLEKYTSKEEIRKIAKDYNLDIASKKDSQEICFIKDNNYVNFLTNNNVPSKEGNFIDKNNNTLGRHQGIIHYTVGQRKGLGISYKYPLYVTSINKDNNTITLSTEEDLYSNELIITKVNLLVDTLPEDVMAKIRYRSKDAKAKVSFLANGDLKLTFDNPQKSITKGQSVVMYQDDICLGGGIIK